MSKTSARIDRAYKQWTYSSRVFWVKIIDELERSKGDLQLKIADCQMEL